MNISGTVEHGKKRGAKLGFPTVNIPLVSLENIEPGVYAGKTHIEGDAYVCAVYIHPRPQRLLEAHILDFKGDLYGRQLNVQIDKKVRSGRSFQNEEVLVAQIQKDIAQISAYYSGNNL